MFDPESAGRAGLRALQHAAGARPGPDRRPRPRDDAAPAPATGPAAVPGMAAAPPPPAGTVAAGPDRGSKQIGPGLSAAAEGAPGSSRAAAAAVQPPGYGLDAGDPEPPAAAGPGRGPRRVARRVALVGALLVAAVCWPAGCALWLTRPAYLDPAAVQRQIADQLTGRLGGPVAVQLPRADQRQRSGGSDVPVHRDRQCRGAALR